MTTAPTSEQRTRRSFSKRNVARQFIQFGMVGASGFIVNQAVFVLCKKTLDWGWDHSADDVLLNLVGTQFNLRWYHLFSTLAFIVANVWNFLLNRYWTFSGVPKKAWWKQLPQFMAVGVFGLLITLAVATALVNPESPIALPADIFNDSTGLRTRVYWGNFIGVIVAVPANFLFNKLWTFRAKPAKGVRTRGPRTATHPVAAAATGAPDADIVGETDRSGVENKKANNSAGDSPTRAHNPEA
ncbi:GtrA family protein [Corynebacterium falsenii]|uniref:GtrA family protein n=1 Tax=Corynebacterium falsenii TaxID=108486 RepID=UPI00234E21C7|nr:GtrA family protein [Corynebacterium falsenii]MDC7104005.1 GtrA family protein [Corynebacterium falsenii]